MITDRLHPEVLFIKCLGSVLIVDVDNKRKITLLDEIVSKATQDKYFRVAVNQYRMLIVAQPNLIEEYTLEQMYTHNSVVLLKMLPTFDYIIQPNADI